MASKFLSFVCWALNACTKEVEPKKINLVRLLSMLDRNSYSNEAQILDYFFVKKKIVFLGIELKSRQSLWRLLVPFPTRM